MQDVCQNEPSKYDLACHESPSSYQWLEHLTGVREVMGSIPVTGTQMFSLSHACDKLNITSFSPMQILERSAC